MSHDEPGWDVADTIKDWDAFVRHPSVEDAYSNPQSWWLFRGQACATHGLCPSLLIALSETDAELSSSNVLAYEEVAREEFVTQAHLYLGPALFAAAPTKLHWWMHMQHFGAPTRLLDWSRSPFVAAYFACEKELDEDGAVWALDIRASDFRMPDIFREEMSIEERARLHDMFLKSDAPGTLHLVTMGLRNERMTAQQGVFMLGKNPAIRHDHVLLDLTRGGDKSKMFRKIRIPKEVKVDFYHRLRSMNINARSLFPGLDGLGRSISEMVRFNAFPDLYLTD